MSVSREMRNLIDLLETEDVSMGAVFWESQFGYGEPPGGPASQYVWQRVEAYPLDRIGGTPEDWKKFMKQEIAMWAEDGDPDYYADMFREEIYQPIHLVEVDGVGYVWDGNHRVGASYLAGRTTIPAIVGIPKDKP